MQTLLFHFANQENAPLSYLKEEQEKIDNHLNNGSGVSFKLRWAPFSTTDVLIRHINEEGEELELFWYSGHAGPADLYLENGEARPHVLAELFKKHCPNLKVVGLNGCATKDQVQALLQNGVPIVIATTAPVEDKRAAAFSASFFEALAKGKGIRESFEDAITNINFLKGNKNELEIQPSTESFRGPIHMQAPEVGRWVLYHKEESQALLESWRLPTGKNIFNNEPPNAYLKQALENISADEDTTTIPKQEYTLGNLPFMIIDPIRQLLAEPVKDKDQEDQFFNFASSQRYDMLLFAYHNLLEFLQYILLSELWKNKERLAAEGLLPLDKIYLKCLKSKPEELFEDLQSLISLLTPMFQEILEPYFPLLKTLDSDLRNEEGDQLFECVESLNDYYKKINSIDHEKKTNECKDVEYKLATLMLKFKEMLKYHLYSIKKIEVSNYMHEISLTYVHKFVTAQSDEKPMSDFVKAEIPHSLRTGAILLNHEHNKDFNNCCFLSPFLIDMNAYIPKEQVPKVTLLAFERYDPVEKAFYYRDAVKLVRKSGSRELTSKPYVFKPNTKNTLQIQKNNHLIDPCELVNYTLIHRQFDAFCMDMFGKKLDEL